MERLDGVQAREAVTVLAQRVADRARLRWRSALLPALVLWLMAAAVAGWLIHSYDVTEYQQYAHGALQAPLFHRLPLEYPAPALAVFLAPLLLPLAYPWAFAVLVGGVLVALALTFETPGVGVLDGEAASRFVLYLALGTTLFLAARYDLFAVAATFWAYRAARRRRWSAAWAWSSIGFAIKLFPAFLWPLLLLAEHRDRGRFPARRLLWVVGAGAVVFGVPALLDPGGAANAARYYLHRPAEIGSVASGLSLLADWPHTHFVASYHSINVLGPVTGHLAEAITAIGAGGCAWTWWRYARGRLSLEAACLASLSCVVLGAKVLSVQYVMWLVPFWALYRLRATWVAAALLNTVLFPVAVWLTTTQLSVHAYGAALTLTELLRDVLIAAGTVAWLREVLGEHRRQGARTPVAMAER